MLICDETVSPYFITISVQAIDGFVNSKFYHNVAVDATQSWVKRELGSGQST